MNSFSEVSCIKNTGTPAGTRGHSACVGKIPLKQTDPTARGRGGRHEPTCWASIGDGWAWLGEAAPTPLAHWRKVWSGEI